MNEHVIVLRGWLSEMLAFMNLRFQGKMSRRQQTRHHLRDRLPDTGLLRGGRSVVEELLAP